MDSGSIFQIIILIILLLLSAFFSSAETALTTVNRIRMRSLAEDGNSRAARVLKVTDDSGKMLSSIFLHLPLQLLLLWICGEVLVPESQPVF